MKLASFDIFDTALIRRCGDGANIIRLAAASLYPGDEAEQQRFYHARMRAHGETIAEIYSSGAGTDFSIDFPGHTPDEFIQAELSQEKANAAANPLIRDEIRRRRAEGCTIAFISDTHLPERFLKQLLMAEGCAEVGDTVYASCEHSAAKYDGMLYDIVRAELKPEQWVHCGDNPGSDIEIPRRKGIKTVAADTRYTAAERAVAAEARRHGWQMNLLAGISRYTRIAASDTPEARLAADAVAPLLVPYTMSVMADARRRGIDRLYFAWRDGSTPMHIARVLDHEGHLDIRPLYISRRALLPAWLAYATESEIREIKQTVHWRNLPEGATDCDSPLQAELARKYLRQSGLLDKPAATAVVDIGWGGLTRLMIRAAAGARSGGTPLYHYLAATDEALPQRHGRYTTYIDDYETVGNNAHLIEAYHSASPQTTVTGYAEGPDGTVQPVFGGGDNSAAAEIAAVNTSICTAAALLIQACHEIGEEALRQWALLSLQAVIHPADDIDLTPMTRVAGADGGPLVRKLSIGETLGLLRRSRRLHTNYAEGKLRYTLGRRGHALHSLIYKALHKIF